VAIQTADTAAAAARLGHDEMTRKGSRWAQRIVVVRVVLALHLALAVTVRGATWQGQATSDEADQLYRDRSELSSAERAASLWEERVRQDPAAFEAAWKLARACYWLGGHVPVEQQRSRYEQGIQAGRQAISVEPKRPEGHFWMAANMGALAESFGLRAGLKYRGPIKDALEAVLEIDPMFQQGSADRALGRWYQKVPRLFGGNLSRSVEHLERSLTYNPNSTASHFFLAETFYEMKKLDMARAELQKVLDAPLDPEWAPEDRDFKDKAKGKLEEWAADR
jgi:tetratricopeptide (TPR) repeat protein